MEYHKPVMLNESIEGLQIKPDGVYVDCTFGGGGHSREILSRLTTGRLIAFDQDEEAAGNSTEDPKLQLVHANFRFLSNFLQWFGISSVDGILADLGVSWHHFDDPARGFSFRTNGKLDMRMNISAPQTAAGLLSSMDSKALERMFREFGELPEAAKLAGDIVHYRKTAPLEEISDLLHAIEKRIPKREEHRFLARVFQSIRMEVNEEMRCLRELLLQVPQWLTPGGRLVVISYHSLEDRTVKNFLRSGNFEGHLEKDLYGNVKNSMKPMSSKALIPTEKELQENNRSRSAKMRIGERI